MKRIVATKCHAEGLATLLPCFWVYMHVGQCMLKLRGELGNRYVASCVQRWSLYMQELYLLSSFIVIINLSVTIHSVNRPKSFDAWIDMYGGEDFEKEVKDYIAMVDAACKMADESTLREMEKHFVMSCKLEHMFWDQAQNKMEWPKIA